LVDGRSANGLQVIELKAALITFGVPDSGHSQLKVDKQVQLKASKSKIRIQQGRRGALEDGRDIQNPNVVDVRAALYARGGDPYHQGCLHIKLRRVDRALTNRLSPPPNPQNPPGGGATEPIGAEAARVAPVAAEARFFFEPSRVFSEPPL
jgi:hypothetical protein